MAPTRASRPPRKRRDRYHHGDLRRSLLVEALRTIQAQGVEGLTLRAVGKALGVSRTALYRHFASKAQMFEGLIEFIEETLFSLINKITSEEKSGLKQIEAITAMLLGFADRDIDRYRLTPEQLAEVELAKQEARDGLFASDEEMAELWRRVGL